MKIHGWKLMASPNEESDAIFEVKNLRGDPLWFHEKELARSVAEIRNSNPYDDRFYFLQPMYENPIESVRLGR